MRNVLIGGANIQYPDALVWKQDASVVKVSGAQNIGAKVYIEEPAGNSYTLEYYSEDTEITFSLDDSIRALYDENIGSWSCKVTLYSGATVLGVHNFTFKVLDGKSFISRSHGVSSTIYVYSSFELLKLQIFSPTSGVAVCGQYGFNLYYGLNQFNLTSAIRNSGEYSICLNDSSVVKPVAVISGVDDLTPTSSRVHYAITSESRDNRIYGGDVFDENKVIFPICHKIIFEDHCDDYNFGEICYTDLDGMRRYLGGKIIEDEDSVKSESYFKTNLDTYNRVPNRYIISHEKIIKLVFSDIEKNAYPHDLLYSQDIQYRTWDGEMHPCAIKTNKFERKDNDYYDIELEIIISQ